jgi:hypothetical protein
MRKPPRYVHGYFDRHGKPRYYFRRSGFKQVPLPGLPWSPQFMAAYELAMAGQAPEIGAKKVRPGTMRSLAVSYFSSLAFRSMKASTQGVYRYIISRLGEEVGKTGIKVGDMPAGGIRREHVVRLMAARAEKPDSANGLRKVLRAMMKHAVDVGMRRDDPTQDVKAIRVRTEGFHSWTEAEIEQFEVAHAAGTRAVWRSPFYSVRGSAVAT